MSDLKKYNVLLKIGELYQSGLLSKTGAVLAARCTITNREELRIFLNNLNINLPLDTEYEDNIYKNEDNKQ